MTKLTFLLHCSQSDACTASNTLYIISDDITGAFKYSSRSSKLAHNDWPVESVAHAPSIEDGEAEGEAEEGEELEPVQYLYSSTPNYLTR